MIITDDSIEKYVENHTSDASDILKKVEDLIDKIPKNIKIIIMPGKRYFP